MKTFKEPRMSNNRYCMHFSTTKKVCTFKKQNKINPPQTLTLFQNGDNLTCYLFSHFYLGIGERKIRS